MYQIEDSNARGTYIQGLEHVDLSNKEKLELIINAGHDGIEPVIACQELGSVLADCLKTLTSNEVRDMPLTPTFQTVAKALANGSFFGNLKNVHVNVLVFLLRLGALHTKITMPFAVCSCDKTPINDKKFDQGKLFHTCWPAFMELLKTFRVTDPTVANYICVYPKALLHKGVIGQLVQ